MQGARWFVLITITSSVAASGCLTGLDADAPASWTDGGDFPDVDCDLVPDDADHHVAPARDCARTFAPTAPGTLSVQFVLATRDASVVRAADAAAVDAAASLASAAFSHATGDRVRVALAGPPRVLAVPGDLASLDEDPLRLAQAFFADPTARRDVHVLVVVAVDVPLASAACACDAWHERARNPGPLGGAFDVTGPLGLPAGFVGVTGLADVRELADGDEVAFRFLHESAHAWCCRLPRDDSAAAALLAARGAHWHPDLVPGDPLGGGRATGEPRYSDLTLAAMGVLDPRDARPVRVPGTGKWVSALDVLDLSR